MDNPEKRPFEKNTKNYTFKYLQFASSLISGYDGAEPFHLYFKKYFSANKKHGSRDRKQITALCYDFFRLGHGVSGQVSLHEKFLLGIFLCESAPSSLLASLKHEWNEKITKILESKLELVKEIFHSKIVFPFNESLSDKINLAQFALSFLKQPKLFIRIRPGKKISVLDKLKKANFSFEKMNEQCIAFAHNEKVTDILSIDKEAAVQDYNSQRVGEFILKYGTFARNVEKNNSPINVWDCCAGSGGKSILAADILKNIQLTVTDIRSSILQNLHKRFASAGIKNYQSFVADIASKKMPPIDSSFELIIADVPCSGSGTWARTPEQLRFFKEEAIDRYALLQKNIIKNVTPHLQDNGILLYITCSVFKKENEDNVDFIAKTFQLHLLEAEYLKGYEMQADTLFVAVFRKESIGH
ncbi:MAG: Fmu (Sun) domain-containing protein [Ginsengibacter sp.]